MTEWLLGLVPGYGPWLLFAAVFLSCFALPIPASVLLLAAGGFAGAGDLSAAAVAGAGLAGVAAGNHSVYALGRTRGRRVIDRLGSRIAPLARAEARLAEGGGGTIFLSRWLFSPLGPYVNFAAGAAGVRWPIFALWGLAGEIVWLSIYLGTGYVSTGSLEAASETAFNAVLALGAGALALFLGARFFRRRADQRSG